ncbi:MAG: hypothetical protein HY534_02930 [Chloroflexi bacterium]|nr:hypothetical protein [Chloroflexota bacterium]
MAVQPVWGGEHSQDRKYPRKGNEKRLEALPGGLSGHDAKHPRHNHAFVAGAAKLIVDDHNQIVLVQVVDPDTNRVVQAIPVEELVEHDYHGILVDLET